MRIDLHAHSTASDGTLRPAELVVDAEYQGGRIVRPLGGGGRVVVCLEQPVQRDEQ